MKPTKPIFRGAATALITPLTREGVDYAAFGRLIDWQIAQGVSALVIAGTTGEGATLSDREHKDVIRYAVERAAGRVPIIAGTGSNNTAHAIELSRYACEVGADALLVVTPYYNKATQSGLVQSYFAIADAVTKPMILYNVPSRTDVNIAPETYLKLAEHLNIAAIKEANGDLSKIVSTMALVGDKLDLYSGNDDLIVPLLSLGGCGVISVLSNVMPAQTEQICSRFFSGDTQGSAKLQLELLPLIHALFSEVNPIPVKAAMHAMGFCEDFVRLPLTVMEAPHRAVLLSLLRQYGLIG